MTITTGINDVGTELASSIDSSSVAHGWVRSPGGDFTQLGDPSSAGGTAPGAINDHGVIVGFYFDASGAAHGFVYAHGTFTTLDYPGAPASSSPPSTPPAPSSAVTSTHRA